MTLWLIGAGAMAQDYAKVLLALNHDFEIIGRGAAAAEKLQSSLGQPVRVGGVTRALATSPAPSQAIVAVGVENLSSVGIELMQAGTRRILMEKPGGLNTAEIRALREAAEQHEADVLIAYNRRFYASTTAARALIAEDGGPTSCTFEFTEWSHLIGPMAKLPRIKAAWFLGNSTHVVDLAFHLCGFPREWSAWHGGSISWHPTAARFCGAGVTEAGVFFSYNADWEAPGRWGVEVSTRRRRFIFRPMEQLQVVALGSVKVEPVEIDDQRDKAFKPGLYGETSAFLSGDDSLFCTVDEQLGHCALYDEMAGYNRGASLSG